MANKTKELYQSITNQILEQLEQQLKTWTIPWINAETGLAKNVVTNRFYTGINQLILSTVQEKQQFPTNNWLTFKQAQGLGGKIIKGSKGCSVLFYTSKEITNKETKESETIVVTRSFTVFNCAQIEGLPQECYEVSTYEPLASFELHEEAEQLLTSFENVIEYQKSNKAYYNTAADSIVLPERTQFSSTSEFYKTVFHELGHWTGHPERLNRKVGNPFGSIAYAKEELHC